VFLTRKVILIPLAGQCSKNLLQRELFIIGDLNILPRNIVKIQIQVYRFYEKARVATTMSSQYFLMFREYFIQNFHTTTLNVAKTFLLETVS